MMRYGYYDYFPRKPSMGQRQQQAEQRVARFAKQGRKLSPVVASGRAIAQSFWGKAWCENIESYSDYENRLPRGRSYLHNGCVVDLQISRGKVTALVSGSSMYKVNIDIEALSSKRWQGVIAACAGKIDSLVGLLQGKLSQSVLEVLVRRDAGLFPSPNEMSLSCSCPDWATLCKHVAATMYGVGLRLDEQPELFFVLRQVDQLELIAQAGVAGIVDAPAGTTPGSRRLSTTGLGSMFGIDLEDTEKPAQPASGASRATTAATPEKEKRSPHREPSRGKRLGLEEAAAGEGRGPAQAATVVLPVSHSEKRPLACRISGCRRPSRGPRFRYLCDAHRSMKPSELTRPVARAASISSPAPRMPRKPLRARTMGDDPTPVLSRALRTILEELTEELTAAVKEITAERVREVLAGRARAKRRRKEPAR